jgi:hypothetical protein
MAGRSPRRDFIEGGTPALLPSTFYFFAYGRLCSVVMGLGRSSGPFFSHIQAPDTVGAGVVIGRWMTTDAEDWVGSATLGTVGLLMVADFATHGTTLLTVSR